MIIKLKLRQIKCKYRGKVQNLTGVNSDVQQTSLAWVTAGTSSVGQIYEVVAPKHTFILK